MRRDHKVDQVVEKQIQAYIHDDKTRLNNPPAGYASYDTEDSSTKYSFDPHLDPTLDWSGKKEHTSFEVPLVSLHVHETINPYEVLKTAKNKDPSQRVIQTTLFDTDSLIARKERLEFYKHKRNWTNRLIAGDSLLVMNSLLEKENMAEKVQMVYLDPPYGIKYGSNFQPFVNKNDVSKETDENLNQEPEMIKAFRDTWELGIHSYLSYLRDRILLANQLLSPGGSIFIQISIENLHHVREICDEIFGPKNFVSLITYMTTSGFRSDNRISRAGDYIVWYAKDIDQLKYHPLFVPKSYASDKLYNKIETKDGERLSKKEWENKTGLKFEYDNPDIKLYQLDNLVSSGASSKPQPFDFEGKTYSPKAGSHWKANYPEGMQRLADLGRIMKSGENSIRYVRYSDDFGYDEINNIWTDTSTGGFNESKIYVVQTSDKIIQRCLLMTTDPGDLVLDITCGSGTTAYVAEKWGRRWITCDTSRIAITLAKQRLMAASYDYYHLLHPEQGIAGGLEYQKVPHITLGSLANNEPPKYEYLVDKPLVDSTKIRVTGPFTVEAIPAPTVQSLESQTINRDYTSKESEWRAELLKTGVLTRAGQKIEFNRVDVSSGTKYVQAEGETTSLGTSQRVAIHFGSESHPLDSRAVSQVLDEVEIMRPSPDIVLFCAFQFDPEAAKFIDGTNWPKKTLLKVQMNTDLLTEDLKKNRSSNQSFWLIGQPDVSCVKDENENYVVTVNGFDYYDVKTGSVESGNNSKISMWMLDTNYDGLSLNPTQIFFPMAGPKDGWYKLSMTLRTELNPELIDLYKGVVSIPFKADPSQKIAVKIIDDRGIESLKVIKLEDVE